MKIFSSRKITFLFSASLSLALLLLLLAARFISADFFHPATIFIIPACAFILCLLLLPFFIENFIYGKIRSIYQTILKLKPSKAADENKALRSDDILSNLDKEVTEWTNRQSKEIETLKELANYRKEFLGNVSHELKTPMFNIQGYLHTLIDGGLEDASINLNYLNKASQNLERLSNIVHDLEMISQIETNSLTLDITRFDIIKLVDDVLDDLAMKADTREIALQLKGESDQAIFVKADRETIRQVLTNLISNSIRYGKQGGTTTVNVIDKGENVAVEVADDGIGIADEHLPRLFERFYRVDKSRSRELGGTGLGLSIVKHIIEAHGQTIQVASKPRAGSTFGFTLKKG